MAAKTPTRAQRAALKRRLRITSLTLLGSTHFPIWRFRGLTGFSHFNMRDPLVSASGLLVSCCLPPDGNIVPIGVFVLGSSSPPTTPHTTAVLKPSLGSLSCRASPLCRVRDDNAGTLTQLIVSAKWLFQIIATMHVRSSLDPVDSGRPKAISAHCKALAWTSRCPPFSSSRASAFPSYIITHPPWSPVSSNQTIFHTLVDSTASTSHEVVTVYVHQQRCSVEISLTQQ